MHHLSMYPKMHQSPSSIILQIPPVGESHSQCSVSKRRGPNLVVVPARARHLLFLENLPYFLLERDAVHVICRTVIS